MKVRKKILVLCLVAIFSVQVFAQNEYNKNEGKYIYTIEEVKKMCGGIPPGDQAEVERLLAKQDSMYRAYVANPIKRTDSAPNWRGMMGPVKNQGCGNCWAHAATGVIEGQLHISIGSNIGINLDEMDPVIFGPCGNCGGGETDCALESIKYSKIRSVSSTYPNLNGVRWNILQWYGVWYVEGIQNALANGPVTAFFEVHQDFVNLFNNPDSSNAVYHWDRTAPIVAWHYVVIVSYDDVSNSWLCKNSWGTNWADGGYFRIGYFQCGIEILENRFVIVDQSCYAKIVPNLINSLGTALNYNFVNNEWAYIIGNTSISSSATLPSSATLQVNSNVTLSFGSGTTLVVNGTLNAIGTSSSRITFDRSGSSGTWGGISLNNAGASSLKYCEIEHAQNGLSINNSDPLIEGCYIHDNSCGISMSTGSEPNLKNNTIKNNSSGGVYCTEYSEPTFGPTDGSNGYNRIINNSGPGIMAFYYSFVELGYFVGSGYRYAYNSLFGNTYYDAQAVYGATIVAQGCWWGTPNPAPSQFSVGYGGQICHTYELASDPGGGSPLGKSSTNTFADKWFDPNNVNTNDPESLWKLALDQRYNGNIEAALKTNKDIIDRFPSTQCASKALSQIFHISEKNDRTDLKNYLKSQRSNKLPTELQGTAFDLSILKHRKDGEYKEAEKLCLEVVKEMPGTQSEILALYNLVSLNSNELGNAKNASYYLKLMKKKYPEERLTLLACEEMGEEVDWSLANQSYKPKTENAEVSIPDNFALHNNYPNPFNPSTVISYQISAVSYVKLSVFDMLGREVATLFDGSKEAGHYTASFHGDKLASGLYFVRFTTQPADGSTPFTKTMKMLMTK